VGISNASRVRFYRHEYGEQRQEKIESALERVPHLTYADKMTALERLP
jgi:hypothetical protein